MIIDYMTAILDINPNAYVQMEGDSYEGIEWNDTPVISQSELDTKITELQAEYDAKQYQRDRQYPSIQEQLDMQYWDSVNGTTTWADAIAAVKEANPKPE